MKKEKKNAKLNLIKDLNLSDEQKKAILKLDIKEIKKQVIERSKLVTQIKSLKLPNQLQKQMLKLSNEEIKTKIKEYKKIQKTQSGQAKKFNNQNKEREIIRKKKEAKANRKIV